MTTTSFALTSRMGARRSGPAAAQGGLEYPQALSEKYCPAAVGEFAGLARPKAIFQKFAAQPYASSWLLLGPSGTGKTTMAVAFARLLGSEIHHIPSRQCDLESVDNVCRQCHYIAIGGSWHVVLVDEADQMSRAAQHAFLSKLDGTAPPPQTIFLFTANATELLEDRFISRNRVVEFSRDDMRGPLVELLARIWKAEGGPGEPSRELLNLIAETARDNVRDALMHLELELMAPGSRSYTPAPAATPATSQAAPGSPNGPLSPAHKAWITRRARLAAAQACVPARRGRTHANG